MFHLIGIHDLESLAQIIDGKLTCQNTTFSSLVVDSRKVVKDSVFLALKGDTYDGSSYCQDAIDKGAVAVITDIKTTINDAIIVDDTYLSLLMLAQYQQQKIKPKTVAITGSNGKTTVKEMIGQILREKDLVITHKNENNEFGIPFTVLRLTVETKYLILECGARKFGDFNLISEFLNFDIVAITNINNSHIEIFETIENIIKTKTKLFNALKHNGLIIDGANFNKISYPLDGFKQNNSTITIYGNNNREVWRSFSEPVKNPGKYNLRFSNEEEDIYTINEVNLGAKHNDKNALISFIIAKKIGIKIDVALEKLSSIQLQLSDRFFIKRVGNHVLIDDTYNANPVSMHAAINELKSNNFYPKNKVIVLGDMLELGNQSSIEHLKLLKAISAMQDIQSIILKGDSFKKALENLDMDEKNDFILHLDENEVFPIKEIISSLKEPSVILIKGSRGMRMEQIVDLFFSNIT